ncbi:RNA-binding protein 7 [Phlebotomus argentipes]|uniref:RNA-binding protein 7 n=1 Tax=Phlebotomus argentipes TaxID=94469 RepID=UPI002892FFA1|nr:RNA-binding protein 7 [Phlebotomus argentipes]
MSDDKSRTLFCGNLSDKVTEELLYELFLQAGPIDGVRIPKARNFGFITYRHESTIPYALRLYSGTRLYGREITIAQQNSPGNEQSGNPASHAQRGMMPQMRPPPAIPPVAMFGGMLDMEQLLRLGQQLNANLPDNFGSSSRGDYFGNNRTHDLVNREKHYRNRDSRKPYGNNRRQRDDDTRGKNHKRNNFRDRHHHW